MEIIITIRFCTNYNNSKTKRTKTFMNKNNERKTKGNQATVKQRQIGIAACRGWRQCHDVAKTPDAIPVRPRVRPADQSIALSTIPRLANMFLLQIRHSRNGSSVWYTKPQHAAGTNHPLGWNCYPAKLRYTALNVHGLQVVRQRS